MLDKHKLSLAIRDNIAQREMPFSVSVSDLYNNCIQVFSSSAILRQGMTYDDLAEELVSQFKTLVGKIYTNYLVVPEICFPTTSSVDDIDTFISSEWTKVVSWFIPCVLMTEPNKTKFDKHIANWEIFDA